MLLHFEATTRQGRLASKIEPKCGTYRPPPLQNLGKGRAKCLSELVKSNVGSNVWHTFTGHRCACLVLLCLMV